MRQIKREIRQLQRHRARAFKKLLWHRTEHFPSLARADEDNIAWLDKQITMREDALKGRAA